MFIKSIRWRLQSWLAFLLVCVLSGFGVTAYQLQRVNVLRQIDEQLELRIAALSEAVRGGPPLEPHRGPFPFAGPPGQGRFDEGRQSRPPPRGGPEPFSPGGRREMRPWSRGFWLLPETASLFDESSPHAYYFAVWSREAALLKRSTNAPADIPMPGAPDDTLAHTRMRGLLRESYHFTEFGDCVLAGRSIRAEWQAMSRFKWWLLAAGSAVLTLGLGGGWWLTSSAIRPVEAISATASRISAGNLAERINVAEADTELGRLAGVLNSTFARLEAAFAQQKQFIADASHELRTPIAVLISEAQTTLARQRSAPEYRQTIEGCLETAQDMRRLTQSLLELAHYDAGQALVEPRLFDLAEWARACVEFVRPLAGERRIAIHCDLAPAQVLGEAERLGQVITNLLTNALHYNREGGEVRVATRAEGPSAVVAVADTGPGIAAADLPHIFERFYRADQARARAQGRTGLGLAICQAIVQAHGGSIEVSSQPGQGTTFVVRLPLG
jgi:two-component system, OmpR family, sensor kinase